MKNQSSFDRFADFIMDKVATPLGRFAALRPMLVIREGLIAVMPVILVGSLFLLIALLGDGGSLGGTALVPALVPYVGNLWSATGMTIGFMSLYAAIAFGIVYARVYEVDVLSMTLMSITSFILITSVSGGELAVGSFGASGMFVAMATTFTGGFILRFCIDKKLVIKLPEGVPPGIANSFSAVIPFAIAFVTFWLIRSILNFDLANLFIAVLGPVFSAADTVFGFTFRVLVSQTFWSVGIHGDSIIGGVTGPMLLNFIDANRVAAAAGTPLTELPYIWTEGLERMVLFTSSLWGLSFWMLISKNKTYRTLALVALPSTIFGIIEPIVFGLPTVLNPFLIIPWILSSVLAAIFGYLFMALGLCARIWIQIPWATPAPLIAFLGTGGDWRALIIVLVSFIIGVVVYYPFFKAMEKDAAAKEAELIAAQE